MSSAQTACVAMLTLLGGCATILALAFWQEHNPRVANPVLIALCVLILLALIAGAIIL